MPQSVSAVSRYMCPSCPFPTRLLPRLLHGRRFRLSMISTVMAGLLLLIAAPATAWPQQYTVTDLGTLGGSETTAAGINNSGVVVGQSYLVPGEGDRHAYAWIAGSLNDLGTLGGVVSGATAINNNGQIVGVSAITGNTGNHAFVYAAGSFTDLGTLGGPDSTAYAINSQGQIVGSSRISGGSADHAFLYSGGSMVDLGTLGGNYSFAYGINDSGKIIGEASVASGYNHAFSYTSGSMSDLGTLGGEFSTATAINNNNQIVGWSLTQTGSLARKAFIYENGTMSALGEPGDNRWTMARAINDQGAIVGSLSDGGENPRAFFYVDGVITDLNTLIPGNSGWVLTDAYGINGNGQITGTGTFNGNSRSFLLTPVTPADDWTFNWPAPGSIWTRDSSNLIHSGTATVWTFSSTPLLWRWAIISGDIIADDQVPRRAVALVTADQRLSGLLIQRQWFPLVMLSGSKNP